MNTFRASDYMPLNEVAETIGCSRDTVYRLIQDSELDGVQLRDHGWWKVHRRSLAEYLARLSKRSKKTARRR
jgi:excisionase family DNA binding protein